MLYQVSFITITRKSSQALSFSSRSVIWWRRVKHWAVKLDGEADNSPEIWEVSHASWRGQFPFHAVCPNSQYSSSEVKKSKVSAMQESLSLTALIKASGDRVAVLDWQENVGKVADLWETRNTNAVCASWSGGTNEIAKIEKSQIVTERTIANGKRED